MEVLNSNHAANLLAELLPDRNPRQWAGWLQNNRNKSRAVAYRVPFSHVAGDVFYERAEIAKFVEWEKGRRIGKMVLTGRAADVMRAFGGGEPDGSLTGRKLEVLDVLPQVDAGTGHSFVQVILNDPLTVYRVDSVAAKTLAHALLEAARVCERVPPATVLRTVDSSSPTNRRKRMLTLTLPETADYLESATIKQTIDVGHALVHTGETEAGIGFVMMNDMFGKTVVSEDL